MIQTHAPAENKSREKKVSFCNPATIPYSTCRIIRFLHHGVKHEPLAHLQPCVTEFIDNSDCDSFNSVNEEYPAKNSNSFVTLEPLLILNLPEVHQHVLFLQ